MVALVATFLRRNRSLVDRWGAVDWQLVRVQVRLMSCIPGLYRLHTVDGQGTGGDH